MVWDVHNQCEGVEKRVTVWEAQVQCEVVVVVSALVSPLAVVSTEVVVMAVVVKVGTWLLCRTGERLKLMWIS